MSRISSWKNWFIYEIYPLSFQDSNGDGIGDLRGIEKRLDYLQSIGVDALWIAPFYPSPMADGGYDITDYYNVHPMFGTLKDVKQLIRSAHKKRLKVLIDLVLNHTSSEHPWFKECIASEDNPKRDWYILRDPRPRKDGEEHIPDSELYPNNWLSVAGGPAWKYDPKSNKFILCSFLRGNPTFTDNPKDLFQPDLNWHNTEVQEALMKVIDYWMKIGVDGFRVDAIGYLSKDPRFRSELVKRNIFFRHPNNQQTHKYRDHYYPTLIKTIKKIAERIRKRNGIIIAEVYIPFKQKVEVARAVKNGGPFDFTFIYTDYDAKHVRRSMIDIIDHYQSLDSFPVFVDSDHDNRFPATRWGGELQARQLHAILLSLPGGFCLLQGSEFGKKDTTAYIDDSYFLTERFNEGGIKGINGRDGCRTAMLWNHEEPNAGFTDSYKCSRIYVDRQFASGKNIEEALRDRKSTLANFQWFISMKKTDLIREGTLKLRNDIQMTDGSMAHNVVVIERTFRNRQYLIINNISGESIELSIVKKQGRFLHTTLMDREFGESIDFTCIKLRPHETICVDFIKE